MPKEGKQLYEFGPFRLDPQERQLKRDGEAVALSPKDFEMLVVLIERRGHLVEKSELMETLWPDSYVEEANLSQHIWALRKALGEGAQKYIETVPKRGYRFTAGVRAVGGESDEIVVEKHSITRIIAEEEDEGMAQPHPAPGMEQKALAASKKSGLRGVRWELALILGVLCLVGLTVALFHARNSRQTKAPAAVGEAQRPGLRSMAVLPFKMIGAGGGDEYLGAGLSDALITRLSSVGQVVVRPTSAVRRYTDSGQDPVAAGQEQGVEAVLDGSVQRAEDRIRLTVQLVRVADGALLWSGVFDERFTNIFAVEDAISEQVLRGLMVRLSAEESARLRRQERANIEAYRAYLKGRYFWNKRNGEGFKKAFEYFNQAVAEDPRYAQAYAGLADYYIFIGGYGITPQEEIIAKARGAAEKALELDERLAEAHTSLALIFENYEWDWPGTEREYRRAIELNPNYATARHWYGEFLALMGRFDEGVAEIKRAQELDPLSLIINTDMGKIYYFARQYDRAIEQLRKTLELDPNFVQAHLWLSASYFRKVMYKEALAELNKAWQLEPAPGILAVFGVMHAESGERGEALKVLKELNERRKSQYVSPFAIALIYTSLGKGMRRFNGSKRRIRSGRWD